MIIILYLLSLSILQIIYKLVIIYTSIKIIVNKKQTLKISFTTSTNNVKVIDNLVLEVKKTANKKGSLPKYFYFN